MNEIEDLKVRKQMSWTNVCYSAQRIDLLIITVSGAGVYVILETLKFSIANKMESLWMLKVSGILFVITIVINIISQRFGHTTNIYDYKWCDSKLKAQTPPTEEELMVITAHDKKARIYNNYTNWSNTSCLATMFVALFLVMLYYVITF